MSKYLMKLKTWLEMLKCPWRVCILQLLGKDADLWLKVIARSSHRPAGILLYDDKKVRLENFASSHRDDQSELTKYLQEAIVPAEGYIDYTEVLGSEFVDDMRDGH